MKGGMNMDKRKKIEFASAGLALIGSIIYLLRRYIKDRELEDKVGRKLLQELKFRAMMKGR